MGHLNINYHKMSYRRCKLKFSCKANHVLLHESLNCKINYFWMLYLFIFYFYSFHNPFNRSIFLLRSLVLQYIVMILITGVLGTFYSHKSHRSPCSVLQKEIYRRSEGVFFVLLPMKYTIDGYFNRDDTEA